MKSGFQRGFEESLSLPAAWSLRWRRPQGSDHLAEVAALQDAFIGFQLGIPFLTAARVNLQ
jgi:hypothetical protein